MQLDRRAFFGQSIAFRLRWLARCSAGRSERLLLLIAPLSGWRDAVVRPGTDLCIEGFPRSANTFATVAFAYAQPPPVILAHHSHLPGQVKRALRLDVPVLLLIREPEDAIASLLIREPDLQVRDCLRAYVWFYQPLLPHLESVVVAEFHTVTQHLDWVIRDINQTFGTAFVPFEHTPENLAAVREQVEHTDRGDGTYRGLSESRVARPSPSRKREKERVLSRIRDERHADHLRICRGLYRRVVARGGERAPSTSTPVGEGTE